MNSQESMAIAARTSRTFPLLETFGFAALVAWFIWQLQDASRFSWLVFPVWLFASFLWNKDTPQSLGWRVDNLWTAAKTSSAILLPCALAIVAIGFLLGGVHRPFLHLLVPKHFFGYMSFCLMQQVGLNSLVTNRLLSAVDSPLRVSLISGLFFALLHWPNPVLVPVTLIGGALMSWLFSKERNILPLAVWQAILGTLVWWAFPVAWHHAMRVGPGFYHFRGY